MNPPDPSPFPLTETRWRGIILALSGAVLIVTVWCLLHGITTIFMHLYYFPIVLVAYRYRWKGFGFATILALAYLGLVIVFDYGQAEVVLGALYRFFVFVGIAAVIAYLSDRLAQAQSSLQQFAELNDRYLSLAPAIVLALDDNGAIAYLNKKGGEILECNPAEVIGKLWTERFLPERERERVNQVISQLVAGRVDSNRVIENPVLTSGGMEKSIRWSNTVLHDENGAITGILAFGEDITEEKWRQEALREMQQFQESVITNANVWISVLEPDGTLLVWNDAAEAISGYKKTGVLGKRTVWKQLYPDKEYRKNVTGEIQRIIGRDTFLENFETGIRCADGATKTIVWNTRGLRDSKGVVTSYIAIGRDVTAQRSAESRAGESSRFLAAMIETLPIPVFFKDAEGKYLGCNPPFEKYIGITSAGLTGKTVYDISPKDLADKYTAADRQVLEHPLPQKYETQVQYADGSRHDVIFYKAPFFNKDGSVGGLIGALLDITERKRVEEELQKSEEKFRAFFTTSRDCVFITSLEGDWLDFNDTAVDLFGYDSREDLLKEKISRIYANPDERDAHIRYIRENGYSFEYPVDLRKKDGTIINALITTVARKDVSGTTIGFQGSVRDITERKRIECQFIENQMQLATAMDLAHLANWELDIPTGTFTFNDRFYAMYATTAEREGGYQMPAEVYAREFVHPDDAGMVEQEVRKAIETTDPLFTAQVVHRIFRRDGVMRYILVRHAVIKDAGGRTIKTHGANQDITERRQAEEALALETRRMESLLSLTLMGQKADSEIISEVVEAAIRLTGSTIGYLATMNEDESVMTMQYWSKSAHESCKVIDKPIVYPIEKTGLWGEAVRQRTPVVTNDYAADSPFKRGTPEGHVPLVRHMNIPIFDGDHIVAVAGVGNKEVEYNEGDIRQLQLLMQGWWQIVTRKRSEETIRRTNTILTTQQETSPDGILVVDESGKILSYNRRFTEIWRIPQEVIDSRSDEQALSCVMENLSDPQEFLSRVRYLYEHREDKSQEEVRLKDGKVLERYSAPMLGMDNRYFGRVWYFNDITLRKQVEEAIRSREEQFRVIFHNQQTGLIMVDATTHTIADANKAALSMMGTSHDQVVGKVCHTFICPAEVGKCPVTDLGYTVDSSERVLIRANGERIPILKSVNPVDIGGRPFLIESFIDLSDRKKMEKQINESRQLFADIISFLPDPTFVIDTEGKVLAWNRAIEQLSGVSAADMIGKGDHEYSLWMYGKRRPIIIDLVFNPDQDAARLEYTTVRWEGYTVTAQTEVILPGSGKKTSLSLVASPLMDAQDRITGAIQSIRDISSLREAEAELARLNANLEIIIHNRTRALEEEVAQRIHAEKEVKDALSYTRSVIEAIPDLIVVLDRNGTVLDINAQAEVLTGLTREQLIGTRYFGYLVDDGTLYDKFSRLLETGILENVIQIRHTDGHATPLSVNATLIGGKDDPDVRIIVSAHDITHQKQDEQVIRASLEEKVILLREVHHRVKNNLQIIISLVNLQMRQTDDPMVKQIMSETQNRVRAMSLVHEKLYRSESLSRIDFADYTRFLATQLFSFYGTDTRRVQLDFAMGKIMVDINTAVPLGLLMNELVSNALKHAFPDGREGSIRISGGYAGDLITLVVRDDGAGIPADFDWKNTSSLGMRLVTSLIDQVDGTIELDRTKGTAFTVTLKKDPGTVGAE